MKYIKKFENIDRRKEIHEIFNSIIYIMKYILVDECEIELLDGVTINKIFYDDMLDEIMICVDRTNDNIRLKYFSDYTAKKVNDHLLKKYDYIVNGGDLGLL